MLPRDFITADGYRITPACRRYLAPLINGEAFPRFRDGLPEYVALRTPVPKRLAAGFEI